MIKHYWCGHTDAFTLRSSTLHTMYCVCGPPFDHNKQSKVCASICIYNSYTIHFTVSLSVVSLTVSISAGILCSGNCSHGDARSNRLNSCVNSIGSHTTLFSSSSYRTCTHGNNIYISKVMVSHGSFLTPLSIWHAFL